MREGSNNSNLSKIDELEKNLNNLLSDIPTVDDLETSMKAQSETVPTTGSTSSHNPMTKGDEKYSRVEENLTSEAAVDKASGNDEPKSEISVSELVADMLNDFDINSTTEISLQQEDEDAATVNDEFIIGNGFEFEETFGTAEEKVVTPEENPKRKKKKSRGGLAAIIWIVCLLAVSFGIAYFAIAFVTDFMGISVIGEEKVVKVEIKVEEGETVESMSSKLKQAEIIDQKWLFKYYCEFKNYNKFNPGVHIFASNMDYSQIINELTAVQGINAPSVKIEIPDAASIEDIAKLMAKNDICTKKEFLNVVANGDFNDYAFVRAIPVEKVRYRLEGYLYPDTYEFYQLNSEQGAVLAIEKMLDRFSQKLPSNYESKLKVKVDGKEFEYTLHDMVTLASIIELECRGYYDEMPKVSAVFRNRLEQWETEAAFLQSSPTRTYPNKKNSLIKYNTYETYGLPPGPLCSTGSSAIEAALNPNGKMKEYFYFLTDKETKFYYSKTYDEHNQTITGLGDKFEYDDE